MACLLLLRAKLLDGSLSLSPVRRSTHGMATLCKFYSMDGEQLGWIVVTCIPFSE
jgi:hypothetical protein